MIFLISAFSLAHIFFYLILAWKWKKIPAAKSSDEVHYFSVIIPVRNEVDNIGNILGDLQNQSYTKNDFEVIVVDDFSNDGTSQKVKNMIKKSELNLKIIELKNKSKQGKKYALTRGIEEAKNPIILTTDADCRIGEKWILSYAKTFSSQIQIVAGSVSLQGDGIFAQMQKTEFAGLVAFGGVTLTANNPSMCSGANLGFKKEAFRRVGGYEGNINIPSGDDEFLLYDIMHAYPHSGKFLKTKEAIVETQTHHRLSSFLNQRSRWVSKWRFNRNPKLRLTAILFFIDYAVFLAGWFMTFNGYLEVGLMGLIFGMRYASNYLFMKLLGNSLNHNRVFWSLFWLQIFYPFHVLFMGVISIFGKYTWKGRKY